MHTVVRHQYRQRDARPRESERLPPCLGPALRAASFGCSPPGSPPPPAHCRYCHTPAGWGEEHCHPHIFETHAQDGLAHRKEHGEDGFFILRLGDGTLTLRLGGGALRRGLERREEKLAIQEQLVRWVSNVQSREL